MSMKHQFRARVRNKNFQYLEDYQILNDFGNIGEALDAILEEHKESDRRTWSLQYVAENVASQVNDTLSKELTKIRLGTNNVDRNTQIIIEIVQGLMQNENIEYIITTENDKPSFLTEVEDLIKNRITHQKQKKDSNRLKAGL